MSQIVWHAIYGNIHKWMYRFDNKCNDRLVNLILYRLFLQAWISNHLFFPRLITRLLPIALEFLE